MRSSNVQPFTHTPLVIHLHVYQYSVEVLSCAYSWFSMYTVIPYQTNYPPLPRNHPMYYIVTFMYICTCVHNTLDSNILPYPLLFSPHRPHGQSSSLVSHTIVWYVSSWLRCCTEGDLKEMKFCGDLSNIYVAIFLMAQRCYTKHILSHSTTSAQRLAVSTRRSQRIHFMCVV